VQTCMCHWCTQRLSELASGAVGKAEKNTFCLSTSNARISTGLHSTLPGPLMGCVITSNRVAPLHGTPPGIMHHASCITILFGHIFVCLARSPGFRTLPP
jgi:hypothetical protein